MTDLQVGPGGVASCHVGRGRDTGSGEVVVRPARWPSGGGARVHRFVVRRSSALRRDVDPMGVVIGSVESVENCRSCWSELVLPCDRGVDEIGTNQCRLWRNGGLCAGGQVAPRNPPRVVRTLRPGCPQALEAQDPARNSSRHHAEREARRATERRERRRSDRSEGIGAAERRPRLAARRRGRPAVTTAGWQRG